MPSSSAVDRISFDLLRLLANDARLSNKQLAAAVNLAPSTCHERLKQMRATGLLRGAHAEIDFKALGFGLEALVQVELVKHKRRSLDAFIARLATVAEVRQVFLITGGFDLLVHVMIRDMEHLKNLAFDHFTSQPAVIRIETSVVFQAWTHHRLPEMSFE